MKKLAFILGITVIPLAILAQGVGQPMNPQFDDDVEFAPEESERRSSSMFHRAKKGNPADQLVYANSLRDRKKVKRAGSQYLALVHTWHNSKEAPVAQLGYAKTLEARGKHEDAFTEYQYLIDHFSGDFEYEDVLDRQYRIATLVMTTRTRFLWLFSTKDGLHDALPLFEKIVMNGPGWEKAPQAQFNMGWIHEQLEDYLLAIDAYEHVEQQYLGEEVAIASAFQKGYCLYKLAMKRNHEERGHQLARAQLRSLVARYAESDQVEQAQKYLDEVESQLARMYYERAVFYDKTGIRQRAALIAYRDLLAKFPACKSAEQARARVNVLDAELSNESEGGDPVNE